VNLESALFFVVVIDFVSVPEERGVSTARCGTSERGGCEGGSRGRSNQMVSARRATARVRVRAKGAARRRVETNLEVKGGWGVEGR
jgi:hypothetical protein